MPGRGLRRGVIVGLAVYLAGAVGIVLGVSHARAWAIEVLSTAEEQAHWQKWKADASRQDGVTGPVARRPPKSDQPPMLVLLRDHYSVIVIAGLTFYSFLFAFAVFLGRGLITDRTTIAKPAAAGGRLTHS
jgi:hypothetical protein